MKLLGQVNILVVMASLLIHVKGVLVESQLSRAGVEFDYNTRDQWPTLFKEHCAGRRQSPININKLKTFKGWYFPFNFKSYYILPDSQAVTNNGHSVAITQTVSSVPSITGGGLFSSYQLHSFHFHWGSKGTQGSEHTIDGISYPMELHLVHVKKKYNLDLGEAAKHSDGLAVLGILFRISSRDNPALAPLIESFADVKDAGNSTTRTDMYAVSSLLPRELKKFYRYKGSLTTPVCNEAVIWTIFPAATDISEAQLTKFRTLLMDTHTHEIKDNYRLPQPLNKRKVFRSIFM